MADKPLFWDRHNAQDRAAFVRFIEPLAVAAWPSPEMRQKHFNAASALVYMLTLQDVPRDVLALGVTQLLQDGVTWMPRPGDVKQACCDVVDQRRAFAVREAQQVQDRCLICVDSKGWMTVHVNGAEKVDRCDCWKRAKAILDGADQPLTRPALPPAQNPEVA